MFKKKIFLFFSIFWLTSKACLQKIEIIHKKNNGILAIFKKWKDTFEIEAFDEHPYLTHADIELLKQASKETKEYAEKAKLSDLEKYKFIWQGDKIFHELLPIK